MKRRSLAVLALCATACQSGGETQSDVVTRTDSAGIEVVTNLTPPGSLSLRALALVPELDITSDEESGVVLFRVSAIEPLEANRIAVGSTGTGMVFLFDGEGELITSFGREGDGPGEFRLIQSLLALPGDSLAVYDSVRRRLTVFSLEGTVGRMVDLTALAQLGSRMHRLPDGFALVGVAGLVAREEPGIYRGRAPSFRLGLAADSVASYGELPGQEMVYGEAFGSAIFGSTLFSGTRGDRLVVGFADSPELREFASTGVLARLIRWPDHDRQVTEARIAEFVEYVLQSVPEAQREQARAAVGAVPMAFSPTEPAYYDLFVADDGAIWVGDYPGPEFLLPETPGPARRWIVIDSTGTLTEVVETPPGFRLMAVANNRAYGVHVDELGVESVRVYAVETR